MNQHRALQPLDGQILQFLSQRGALTELTLWRLTKERFMTNIVQACTRLCVLGFIQSVGEGSFEWRITRFGLEECGKVETVQEVPPCS